MLGRFPRHSTAGSVTGNSVATIREGKVVGGDDDGGRNEDAPIAIISRNASEPKT